MTANVKASKSLRRSISLGIPELAKPLKPRSSSIKRTNSKKNLTRSSSAKRRIGVKKAATTEEPSKRDRSKPRKKRPSDANDPQLLELLQMLEDNPQGACVLLDKEPSLAEMKDAANGSLPLHYATQHDLSLEVIEKLMETYPEACDSPCDKNGFTPLHYAVDADIATPKIKALIKACPRSLKTPDRKGQVPLHVAACRNVSLSSIRLLVFIYPESVDLETTKGETPRKIAKRKKASAEVLSALKSGGNKSGK